MEIELLAGISSTQKISSYHIENGEGTTSLLSEAMKLPKSRLSQFASITPASNNFFKSAIRYSNCTSVFEFCYSMNQKHNKMQL
jgi:hypothetical protein